MKRFLVAAAALAAACPALGQGKGPDRTAIYEDVEVMRRLLADAVGRARPATYNFTWIGRPHRPDAIHDYIRFNNVRPGQPNAYGVLVNPLNGNVNTVWSNTLTDLHVRNMPDTALAAAWAVDPTPPPTDGTYLKGVGPVFTLALEHADAVALDPPTKAAALAANCAHCHGRAMDAKAQPPAAAPKPAADDPWDATLRQVRGEKEPTPPDPPATRLSAEEVCLPGKLTELVLTTLARYGHRFRDLPAGERLTVVVTVKGATPPTAPSADPAAQARAEADEQVALGDLHAKQGKVDDAAAAYRKAVEALAKPLRYPATTPADQVTRAVEEMAKALRNVHGKLAQALLAAGKLDEAKAAIEAAKTASPTLAQEKERPAAPQRPPLPTKLTVTLPKKAVDDHRAGRLSPSELRAAAEVEAIGFPAAGPKRPQP